MNLKRFVAGAVAGFAFAGMAYASDPCVEGMDKLMEGNKNFCSGKCSSKAVGEAKMKELAAGQKPFAIVLTCSDSRVSPEILFDQGMGDIFVVRVAGNVVDPIALGSIEYAAEHLHSSLLVILGHQSCGAVGAALEAEGEPEGNIGEIIKKIKPAVDKAKAANKKDAAETLDMAIQENVKNVYADILANSPVMEELIEAGKVKVMLGEYYLDSGQVKVIDAPKAAEEHKAEAKGAHAGGHH